MLKLLKRLSWTCWGEHEWIYRTNDRGLYLECRQCGHVSAGLALPPAQYRRTQESVPAAHRIGGVPPARIAAVSRPTLRVAPLATSDAERRWLQAWRALSPEERVLAERLVARIAEHRVAHAS
jgi:hypothetical protein